MIDIRHEKNRDIYWSQDGRLLREDGSPVIYSDGTKIWVLPSGEFHRENDPAVVVLNGYKAWFFHGQRHREDGPAIEKSNGDKEWWLNGIELTEDEFNHWLEKKNLNEKLQSSFAPRHKEKNRKI